MNRVPHIKAVPGGFIVLPFRGGFFMSTKPVMPVPLVEAMEQAKGKTFND